MKVSELLELLKTRNPNEEVLIRLDGSIFPTDDIEYNIDYNQYDEGIEIGEFYVCGNYEFRDGQEDSV